MNDPILRTLTKDDVSEVTDLICASINHWHETHGRSRRYHDSTAAGVFCEVYEALDPGCCVVAESPRTGRLMGSCFYRERETHVALGIMNVHPNYFGQSVGSRMLARILEMADRAQKPARLVSSAINLDSFSLYNRAGFVPIANFHTMCLQVPDEAFRQDVPHRDRVRPAVERDIPGIADLEQRIAGIRREKDYRFLIENASGHWYASVFEEPNGEITGFLGSIAHPGSNMIGPGFARAERQALALLVRALDWNRGRRPVFLLPMNARSLVTAAYAWGARNTELHYAQVRGSFQPFQGPVFPTFMPETG